MSSKLVFRLISLLICLFIVAVCFVPAILMSGEVTHNVDQIIGDTTQTEGMLYDTLLTYQQFKNLEQEEQSKEKTQENRDAGTGTSFQGLIGFMRIEECDTCTSYSFRHHGTEPLDPPKYYLMLPGYTLEGDDYFHVKNGRYYIKYTKWDGEKGPGGRRQRWGHYESKEVPFRFSYKEYSKYGVDRKGSVLIPVSEKTYNILYWPVVIITFAIWLAGVYICLALPAKMLIRISRGEIFITKHIRQLYLIGWVFLLSPFVIILLQYLFRLIFYRYITAGVKMAPLSSLYDNAGPLITGLVVLAIAKAFSRGLSLQKEQELTV